MANVRYHKVGQWPVYLLFSLYSFLVLHTRWKKNNTPLQATELKKKEE